MSWYTYIYMCVELIYIYIYIYITYKEREIERERDKYIVNGSYKPTYSCGAPHYLYGFVMVCPEIGRKWHFEWRKLLITHWMLRTPMRRIIEFPAGVLVFYPVLVRLTQHAERIQLLQFKATGVSIFGILKPVQLELPQSSRNCCAFGCLLVPWFFCFGRDPAGRVNFT